MKFARVMHGNEPRLVLVTQDQADVETLAVLERDISLADLASGTAMPVPGPGGPRLGTDVDLLLPIPEPGKIVCVGLNYVDHAAETQLEPPKAPLLFAKTNNTLLPHGGNIALDPDTSAEVDFEGELTVVIGRRASRVDTATALEHVFGYTIANDVSARDLQFSDGQWMRGKSLDTFCPVGPYLVTVDEVPDPQQLPIVTKVNGVVMQQQSTADMIFSVAEIISYVSKSITLDPGDIILTGTPSGVGYTRKPPVFLADGDTVTISIEPIGTLCNGVVADHFPAPGTDAIAFAGQG
jgi:2-keto-4-pentenoate hydratase/2-oxohepta-3-ene-1,7-dioic acid hydratase in catechol pathway